MKNADHMLRKIMTVVDTNDDGKIQYEGESSVAWDWSYWPGSPVLRRLREIAADDDLPPEFRCFVEQTERQLMFLFQSIDKDNDGRLDKTELQEAFRRAGLVVPMRKLASFFGDIDMNNDGYISFEEWR